MFYCPKSKPPIELTCHLHECLLGTGCTMWCCAVCIPLSGLDLRNRKVLSIYMYSNKKNITWWQADMDFIFSWQEKQLTRPAASLVRYCSRSNAYLLATMQ